MINSYCNLKCPYCFADNEITDCSTKNMSINDFEKIIEWHKLNNERVIRIIGGEPTLHPNFTDMLYRIMADDFIEGVHVFSNMTFNEEVKTALIDFSTEKRLSFLPNFNEEFVIGPKYDLVKKNIKIFASLGCIETLGINIYKHDYDFDLPLNLAVEYGIKDIRWAITVPNETIDDDFNVKGYFNGYYETMIRFFKTCNLLKLNNHQDCNSIPMCSFTDSQVVSLLKHNPKLFSKDLSCGVVLDVNPKMEAFRCFGLSEDFKIKLNHKSTFGFYKTLIEEETLAIEEKLLFTDCLSCEVYKYNGNRSCACINYRKNKKRGSKKQ
ncbi:MAG: radical SAM protein [Paraclostridium sp.]